MMNTPVLFTKNAAAKVWQLIQEEGNFNLKLRAYVTGGGCSGLQYGFTFDETTDPENDHVITQSLDELNGAPAVHLVIDAQSLQYLAGAEIDYKKDIEGEQFIIRNPNAKTTCGCGSSFSAE